MPECYLLGVDAGQTTVKAVLHDDSLRQVAIARRHSPITRPQPRFAERSQGDLWQAAADAIAEVIAGAGIDARQITAVGISGHGDGLHLIDRTGQPVGPAITAVDTRAHQEAAELAADPERARLILERSGQQPPTGGAGPLLLWMRRHQPHLLQRADSLLFCKDIIRMRLTGDIATDYSDATATFLDVSTSAWSPQILAAYDLEELERLLPPLRTSGASGGHVTREAAQQTGLMAGTPVVVGLHDVQANSIGMGTLIPDRLALVAGSFSTNGVTTEAGHVDPRWQSRVSIRPGLRVAMSTSATAAPALEWTLNLLGATDEAARDGLIAAAAALAPTEPVPVMLPYLCGAPFDPAGTGTMADLKQWHTRAHVLRGALQAIALMHRQHTCALAEKFTWHAPVRLGGGLSRSDLYVQLVAGALQTPIQVVRTPEAGAFGAAALAGVSAGMFADIDHAQEHVTTAATVHPDPALRPYWEETIARAEHLHHRLQPWWEGHHGPH